MKKQYISPQLEKFTFAVCDVIMTSAAGENETDPDPLWNGKVFI